MTENKQVPNEKTVLSSKTIHFNTWLPLLMWGADLCGLTIPPAAAVGLLSLGNIVLRKWFTKEPITKKEKEP